MSNFLQTDKPLWRYGVEFLVQLVLKVAYVALFMMLPRYFFVKYMPDGAANFALENSYIYWGLIMSGLCGSINNSIIFKQDGDTDAAAAYRPKNINDFFRGRILVHSVYDILTFMVAFTVWGMGFAKAFYLSLVIMLLRFMGHTFNILMFRATGKSVSLIKGGDIPVMVISLLFAYYIPYAIGYVPNAYGVLFDTVWFVVFMVVSSIFMYYVWNYHGYGRIFNAVCEKDGNEDDSDVRPLDEEIRHVVSDKDFSVQSYNSITRSFFVDNMKLIVNHIVARVIFIVAALVAVIVACAMGNQKMVYTIIQYSMSALPFIVLIMNLSGGICKDMFYQCDVKLLQHPEYRRRNDVMENFVLRLRCLVGFDLVPSVLLALVYMVAGILCKGEADRNTVVAVCVGTIFLSIFFTVLRLVMYYVLQPYSKDSNKGNVVHLIINVVLFILCAGLVYVDMLAIKFTTIVGVVLGGFTLISVLFVEFLGYRAFKLKK